MKSDGKRYDCVVSPDGTIFGCFPFVGFGDTLLEEGSFFWVWPGDGTLLAYRW